MWNFDHDYFSVIESFILSGVGFVQFVGAMASRSLLAWRSGSAPIHLLRGPPMKRKEKAA